MNPAICNTNIFACHYIDSIKMDNYGQLFPGQQINYNVKTNWQPIEDNF